MKKVAIALTTIIIILGLYLLLFQPNFFNISTWKGWQQGLLFFAALTGLHFLLHALSGPKGPNPPDFPP